MNFRERVNSQIKLLNEGKPLEAIDEFFSENIEMFDNDNLFAKGKVQSRAKQEPFINSAKSISGKITDVLIDESKEICIYRNRSTFINSIDEEVEIDGLCWQSWKEGYVAEERYYSGELMLTKIKKFYS